MAEQKVPKLFRVRTKEDLSRIPFENGVAAVEVPARLLRKIDFKNYARGDSPRLDALRRSIRARGYQPLEPITVRIGKKGRWIVLDGGHRLTATQQVMREFWTNLFRPKVNSLYFVLFADEASWRKAKGPHPEPPPADPEASNESRMRWERARRRMRGVS